MPKTRRVKQSRWPTRPYRNSKPYVAEKGETVQTSGFRGRTRVVRVTDEAGKRVATVRRAEEVVQKPSTSASAKPVQIGRAYTGVARSKPYPYRGAKRGGAPIAPGGNMIARAARAVKKVIVREAAE
jgi:hypothetical protein